jgi:hypothetical protein
MEAEPWVHSAIPQKAGCGGFALPVARENAVTRAAAELFALDTKWMVVSRDLVSGRESDCGRQQRK